MGKSIFDFANQNPSKKKEPEQKKTELNSKDIKNNINDNDYEKISEKVNEYGSMSEEQLVNELKKEVQSRKADGTFDYNSIVSMSKNLEPYLSREQQEMLNKLINGIK